MKKLNLHLVEEALFKANLKIFSPQDLKVMFEVSQRAVEGFLHYNFKKGALLRLKKGWYSLKKNMPSDWAIANKIYSPSYVSLETALSYYQLIPETVYAMTSVTTKSTREFEVIDRIFKYQKIKKEAFTGYLPKKIGEERIFMAVPEKAMVDFLYFVFLGKKKLNERINWSSLRPPFLKEYSRLFGREKFVDFCREVREK